MTIHEMNAVAGSETAIRTKVDRLNKPGVYEIRDGWNKPPRYLIIDSAMKQIPCDLGEAERAAFSELTDGDLVAHDVVLVEEGDARNEAAKASRSRIAEREEGLDDLPEGVEPWSARAALIRAGHDWIVTTELIYVERHDGNEVIPMARAFTREDTAEVLSVQGTDATPVNNRDALSLVDESAEVGMIEYERVLTNYRYVKINPKLKRSRYEWRVDEARVGVTFKLTEGDESTSGGRALASAGGMVLTSHDGSTAIEAVATVRVAGVLLYAPISYKTKHTSRVGDRLRTGRAAMESVVSSARELVALVRRARTCKANDGRIAWRIADALWPLPKDPTEKQKKAFESIVLDMHKRAKAFGTKKEYGALRYVLSARGRVQHNNDRPESAIPKRSYRRKVTEALLAVARLDAEDRAFPQAPGDVTFGSITGGE